MKKYFLAEYVSERLFSVRKELKKYRKQQKQSEIHALRVNIKQLRAIFFFLNKLIAKQPFPRKILTKLYDDSGLLRESHINLGLAKKLQFSETIIDELKENKSNLSDQFLAKTQAYLKNSDRLEKKINWPHYTPRKKELTNYFTRQIRKAKTYLKNSGNEKNIHLFRMKIKEILFVHGALPAKMKKWVGLNEKYLNNLQERSGKWHDTFVAISFFENIIHKPDEKLAALKEKEEKRRNSFLKYSKNFETRIYT